MVNLFLFLMLALLAVSAYLLISRYNEKEAELLEKLKELEKRGGRRRIK